MELRKFNNKRVFESLEDSKITNPSKLSDAVVSLIEDRIKDEYLAFFFYRNAANWCLEKNYKKAYTFFVNEYNNELTHAQNLEEFLISWNVLPKINKTETIHNFTNLYEIINQAYKVEFDLYTKYNQDSKKYMEMGEFSVYDFIGEFRKIQMESVAEYSDLLNALNLIDINNKFDLLYFEQTYM